jgi:Zn-ribbon RNA-binding protein
MEQKVYCASCKTNIANVTGTVKFNCPKCGKLEIVRCKHCREIAAKYKCSSCGFEGPN